VAFVLLVHGDTLVPYGSSNVSGAAGLFLGAIAAAIRSRMGASLQEGQEAQNRNFKSWPEICRAA